MNVEGHPHIMLHIVGWQTQQLVTITLLPGMSQDFFVFFFFCETYHPHRFVIDGPRMKMPTPSTMYGLA